MLQCLVPSTLSGCCTGICAATVSPTFPACHSLLQLHRLHWRPLQGRQRLGLPRLRQRDQHRVSAHLMSRMVLRHCGALHLVVHVAQLSSTLCSSGKIRARLHCPSLWSALASVVLTLSCAASALPFHCPCSLAAIAARGISMFAASGDSGAHGRTDSMCFSNVTRPIFPGCESRSGVG